MAELAIVGGTLIDGNGGAPIDDAVISISNGRILAAGARNGSSRPDAARTIDATGKFIVPGIVNANVHLLDGWMMMTRGGVEYLARFEGRLHEVIEESSQVALSAGMTTVVDTWNALQPVLHARDRIAAGTVPGARIFAAGNIIGMGGPFTADFNKQACDVSSKTFVNRMNTLFEAGTGRRLAALPPEQIRTIIRDYLSNGVDMLKIAISDHILPESRNPHLTFSPRVLRVMKEEALAAGVPLLSHATSVESFHQALELDVDAMMHCTLTAQVPIPEDFIERMIKQTCWGEVQPVVHELQCHLNATMDPMASYAGFVHQENLVRLIKAGAPILMGTDAGCTDPDILAEESPDLLKIRPWTLGQDHLLWFKAMTELGMKPMDMLMAATRNPARAYHKDDLIGTLTAGKLADLLVLNGNPLIDCNNYAAIDRIFKDGMEVDFKALPAKRLATNYPRMEPANPHRR